MEKFGFPVMRAGNWVNYRTISNSPMHKHFKLLREGSEPQMTETPIYFIRYSMLKVMQEIRAAYERNGEILLGPSYKYRLSKFPLPDHGILPQLTCRAH